MKQLVATMNQRNQVTLPLAVRRLLKINPGDRLVFVLTGQTVQLLPAKAFSLESAAGSIPALPGIPDPEVQIRAAKEEKHATQE